MVNRANRYNFSTDRTRLRKIEHRRLPFKVAPQDFPLVQFSVEIEATHDPYHREQQSSCHFTESNDGYDAELERTRWKTFKVLNNVGNFLYASKHSYFVGTEQFKSD